MVANHEGTGPLGPVVASNPLAARRQTFAPVLKSSSRASLTGTSCASIDNFQKLMMNNESLSLRPNRRSSGAPVPRLSSPSSVDSGKFAPPSSPRSIATRTTSMPISAVSSTKSLPGARNMNHTMFNLEDSLRKQTLQHRHKSPITSPTEVESPQPSADDKSPLRRFSSFPSTMEPSSRRSSASLKDAQVQVMRRSVSIVGGMPAPQMSTSPPRCDGSPSILEIRSQIPCRNLKQNGVCQFGTRCHYKHDGVLPGASPSGAVSMAAVSSASRTGSLSGASMPSAGSTEQDDNAIDKQILDIRKEIPCRNFLAGCCTFGTRCFYKHCDSTGKVVEETGVDCLNAMSLLRFSDPYGDGDICAAGVIPYARPDNKEKAAIRAEEEEEVWALFQVEDMLNEETGKWSAALAMFGGKVGPSDTDWLHTAAREFTEETGGLVGDVEHGIPRKMALFVADDEDDAFRYTKYLEYSKFQCLYFPVSDPEDMELMRALPEKYTETFKGEVSKDWTRAATRLEPVLLVRDEEAGWKVCDIQTRQPHTLPLKVPLAMALKAAEFPWPPPNGMGANKASSSDTQLEDLLGGLDSLLNISIKPATVPRKKSIGSAPSGTSKKRQSITLSALKALDESPHEAAYLLRSSGEIACCN